MMMITHLNIFNGYVLLLLLNVISQVCTLKETKENSCENSNETNSLPTNDMEVKHSKLLNLKDVNQNSGVVYNNKQPNIGDN